VTFPVVERTIAQKVTKSNNVPLIWLELRRWIERGEDGALVTVVRTAGSAYQREGTKMLMRSAGGAVGTISGGCLEADLYEHCRRAIERDEPKVVSYSAGGMMDGVFGLGTGCLGTIDVLVEPLAGWRTARGRALLGEIVGRVERRSPFVVATVLPTAGSPPAALERLLVDSRGAAGGSVERSIAAVLVERALGALGEEIRRPSRAIELEADGRRREALLDVFLPPPRLVVFGAGEDALPLTAIAAEVGMDVTVADWRPELVRRERFIEGIALACLRPEDFPADISLADRPAVVLMTHNYEADRLVLERLVASRAALSYLGVLGPRSRTERLVTELAASGCDTAALAIRTPAGLDLGADAPAEIALSIVAEIVSVRKGGSGRPLIQNRGRN
jgi:xanthine dehydrogenase accessory factor